MKYKVRFLETVNDSINDLNICFKILTVIWLGSINKSFLEINFPGGKRVHPHPIVLHQVLICIRAFKNLPPLVYLRSFPRFIYANSMPKTKLMSRKNGHGSFINVPLDKYMQFCFMLQVTSLRLGP